MQVEPKHALAPIANLITRIGTDLQHLEDHLKHDHCGKHTGYKKRTAKLVELGIITTGLQAQLDGLWDWRNNEHLFMLAEWEYGKYELKHYNAAIITLRQLHDSIDKWATNRPPTRTATKASSL